MKYQTSCNSNSPGHLPLQAAVRRSEKLKITIYRNKGQQFKRKQFKRKRRSEKLKITIFIEIRVNNLNERDEVRN